VEGHDSERNGRGRRRGCRLSSFFRRALSLRDQQKVNDTTNRKWHISNVTCTPSKKPRRPPALTCPSAHAQAAADSVMLHPTPSKKPRRPPALTCPSTTRAYTRPNSFSYHSQRQ
jgi:hypothetical protein